MNDNEFDNDDLTIMVNIINLTNNNYVYEEQSMLA